MRKVWVLAFGVLILSLSMSVFAGEYLMNDTGGTVTGLRLVFSKPVTITGFGDTLMSVEPQGESTEFVFSGGEVESWGGHWVSWQPEDAVIETYEWFTDQVAAQLDATSPVAECGENTSDTPSTYLYVPKISWSPAEKKCFDCKTFAIVAVMRYYGEDVEFSDICREVGEPPGPSFEDVHFFRNLLRFVRSRGFVIEPHYWNVDQIIKAVTRGRPVIASHRIGDLPAEPGVVKGFNESHLWVWGIWEQMKQGSADSLYTLQQFETLLERRDSGTGMMGYVPYIWISPLNCLVIYKPSVAPSAPTYPIDAVSYMTRLGRTQPGGPGVVEVLSASGDGEMKWVEPFTDGVDQQIEVFVFDDRYVMESDGSSIVRFAVRFKRHSPNVGSVILGYQSNDKSIWSNAFGYPFEEIKLPVTRMGDTWIGSVQIRPRLSVDSLYVLAAPDPVMTPFFGYEIQVEP